MMPRRPLVIVCAGCVVGRGVACGSAVVALDPAIALASVSARGVVSVSSATLVPTA